MMRATLTLMLTSWMAVHGTAAAADLSGRWTFDGDVQGNAVNLTCAVQQSADAKVTGKCQVNGTETTEIEGSAKDAAFTFSFTVMGYLLTYTGTLNGDAVSGAIEVAGASGTFKGTRLAP